MKMRTSLSRSSQNLSGVRQNPKIQLYPLLLCGFAVFLQTLHVRVLADPAECSKAADTFKGLAQASVQNMELAEKYRAVLALCPRLLEASHNLALILIQNGKVDEAVSVLREALDRSPKERSTNRELEGKLRTTLGAALLRQREWDKAAQEFEAAQRVAADDPAVSLGLLEVALGKGEAATVRTLLATVRAQPPQGVTLLLRASEIFRLQGDVATAADLAQRAAQLPGATVGDRERAALLLEQVGKHAEALKLVDSALLDDAHALNVRLIEARLLLALEQYAVLDVELTQLRSEYPRTAEVLGLVGVSAQRQRNLEAAEKALREAVEIDPAQQRYLAILGTVLLEREKFSDAERILRRAITLDAGDAASHNNLGVALMRLGNGAEAKREFEQANQLNPSLAESRQNLGANP